MHVSHFQHLQLTLFSKQSFRQYSDQLFKWCNWQRKTFQWRCCLHCWQRHHPCYHNSLQTHSVCGVNTDVVGYNSVWHKISLFLFHFSQQLCSAVEKSANAMIGIIWRTLRGDIIFSGREQAMFFWRGCLDSAISFNIIALFDAREFQRRASVPGTVPALSVFVIPDANNHFRLLFLVTKYPGYFTETWPDFCPVISFLYDTTHCPQNSLFPNEKQINANVHKFCIAQLGSHRNF